MQWIELDSRQNPMVKTAVSLAEKKGRRKTGLFLAEGFVLAKDFASCGLFPHTVFLSRDRADQMARVEETLAGEETCAYLVAPHVFEKITTERGSEGLVSLYRAETLQKQLPLDKTEKLLALEEVQDPGNLGTILRSAAAMGFDAVLTVGGADPFGVKAVRASMGALARIPVRSFSDVSSLCSFLEQHGVRSVAACLSADAVEVSQICLDAPICLWIGNEGTGLSDQLLLRVREKCIIPMEGTESLNAAVAASILMWETRRRQKT